MIPLADVHDLEKTFTFITQNGEVYHFAADRLRTWCTQTRHEIVSLVLSRQFVLTVIEGHGVEPHRLAAIKGKIREPVLIVNLENGCHTCIDGNHRVVVAATRGDYAIPAFIVPKRVWSVFLIDDPEDKDRPDAAEYWRNKCRTSTSGIDA